MCVCVLPWHVAQRQQCLNATLTHQRDKPSGLWVGRVRVVGSDGGKALMSI